MRARSGLIVVCAALAGCDGASDDGLERRDASCSRDGTPPTTLTPAQRKQVVDIVRSDSAVKGVLGDSVPRVKTVGAWTNGNELQGGVLLLGVEPPAAPTEVPIPITVQPPAGRPDTDPCLRYLPQSAVVTAENVTELMVLADLKRDAVVEIRPGPASTNVSYEDVSGPEPSDAYGEALGY